MPSLTSRTEESTMSLVIPLHRKMSRNAAALIAVCSLAAVAFPAFAAKPQDFGSMGAKRTAVAGASSVLATSAVSNLPLCAAAGDQSAPVYISDGNGGGIAVWSDQRAGNYDIYAQRLDANGDAMWPAYGVVVCKAAGDQVNPQAVSDGAGGVIVAWEDGRTGFGVRVAPSGKKSWVFMYRFAGKPRRMTLAQ